jgi:hypothetical protein
MYDTQELEQLLSSLSLREEVDPIFTRYLYEKEQVKRSLALAIGEYKREEALFWAYELYHSRFQEEVWSLISELYNFTVNPLFTRFLENNRKDPCMLGTIVGTLSIRNNSRVIILYREDRHATATPQSLGIPPYQYLNQVSQYPIRIEEGTKSSRFNDAYLGGNWLYYCRNCPLWKDRISRGGGRFSDRTKTVIFDSDDALESFYDEWGLEPDEQSREMHLMHGVSGH